MKQHFLFFSYGSNWLLVQTRVCQTLQNGNEISFGSPPVPNVFMLSYLLSLQSIYMQVSV